jgi:dTDP-4-dehydrorhamnose 3,5-epimerase
LARNVRIREKLETLIMGQDSHGVSVTPLGLEGLLLIELKIWGDERGFFVERYQSAVFDALGLPAAFVQDNHSRSLPGVLRGLHYQPGQGKLVGIVRGRAWDVAVDIRPTSKTFGQHAAFELNDTNGRLLWIPKGFAHGFCVLGDEPADILYKVDARYDPAAEAGLHWADPDLSIAWPVKKPAMSVRDRRLPSFAEFRATDSRPNGY